MLSVAYLGPAGTYTDEAMRASAAGGIDPRPCSTVYETVMAVQDGEVDRAVVPIENSIEGAVGATLDALAGEAADVRVAAEVVRPVRHCLVAAKPLPLEQITRVLSHPQATAQCARYLRERLPQAERAGATSTAEAVRSVRSAAQPWAALGSRLSAELYGCVVLAEGVEDHADNVTRFVWLAPAAASVPKVEGPAKTSIVFWGFNDSSPGALVSVLGELSDRSLNLTKIESRPRRRELGNYMFFADVEGHQDQPEVAAALAALGKRVETLRVLGSYPAAA